MHRLFKVCQHHIPELFAVVFADEPAAVGEPVLIVDVTYQITEDAVNEEGITVLHLTVAPDDMGRVIGKQGRIAKALRTIMRAGAAKKDLKVTVTIEE